MTTTPRAPSTSPRDPSTSSTLTADDVGGGWAAVQKTILMAYFGPITLLIAACAAILLFTSPAQTAEPESETTIQTLEAQIVELRTQVVENQSMLYQMMEEQLGLERYLGLVPSNLPASQTAFAIHWLVSKITEDDYSAWVKTPAFAENLRRLDEKRERERDSYGRWLANENPFRGRPAELSQECETALDTEAQRRALINSRVDTYGRATFLEELTKLRFDIGRFADCNEKYGIPR